MMNFENKVIEQTIDKLINGEDYRSEIVNAINVQFLDFSLLFFKDIIRAKLDEKNIDINWYKKYFILNKNLETDEIAIYSGMNKKTITNIYGSATKEIVLNTAEKNFDYLSNLINELNENEEDKLNIQLKITYNKIAVELSISESLLVINALATKKIAIRGGAWSSIGKKVEKPLMIKLCELCNVPEENINSTHFRKNEELDFDREIDFKLYDKNKKEIKCEVKLMGKGNPESADAVIARDSDIFIADTLSEQNKAQLTSLGIKWIELKNHSKEENIDNFDKILKDLNIL